MQAPDTLITLIFEATIHARGSQWIVYEMNCMADHADPELANWQMRGEFPI